nr:hypothetical protein [Tanacetum cinerariifolium]
LGDVPLEPARENAEHGTYHEGNEQQQRYAQDEAKREQALLQVLPHADAFGFDFQVPDVVDALLERNEKGGGRKNQRAHANGSGQAALLLKREFGD